MPYLRAGRTLGVGAAATVRPVHVAKAARGTVNSEAGALAAQFRSPLARGNGAGSSPVVRPGSVSGNPANRLVETGTPLKDGTGWVKRWTRMTAEQEIAQAEAIANRYNQVLQEAKSLPIEQQQSYIFEQMQKFRTQYRQDFLNSR